MYPLLLVIGGFSFDKKKGNIAHAVKRGQSFNPGARYYDRLNNGDHEKIGLSGISHLEDHITIHEFMIKYFRENDMKEYNRKEYFFIDDYEIFSHADFINNEHYPTIMTQVINYKFLMP